MASLLPGRLLAYRNFEHLEAVGRRLLPEQLKTMLKALARDRSKPDRSDLDEGNAEDWFVLIT